MAHSNDIAQRHNLPLLIIYILRIEGHLPVANHRALLVVQRTGFYGQIALAGDAARAAAAVVTQGCPLRIYQQIFSALNKPAVVVLQAAVGQ